jgi:hypothetical protein
MVQTPFLDSIIEYRQSWPLGVKLRECYPRLLSQRLVERETGARIENEDQLQGTFRKEGTTY